MNLAVQTELRRRRTAAALGLLAAVLITGVAAAEAPGHPALFKKMMGALESGDYEAFVAGGDPAFKAALSKPLFDGTAAKLAPLLKAGYTPTYLGTLNQGGWAIQLWKLSFKDREDDLLVKMAMKDGKVAGFNFQ
ncbi:MAG TPA: hypothetical protein VL084_11010 [Thermoanaerobaculia bacterium]|nr:hypothetical protein [Thermoanaerobaculia bacterium]